MPDLDLFQRALGLEEPWQVVDVKFDAAQRQLDLRIDFPKRSKFPCPILPIYQAPYVQGREARAHGLRTGHWTSIYDHVNKTALRRPIDSALFATVEFPTWPMTRAGSMWSRRTQDVAYRLRVTPQFAGGSSTATS